jgi:hypothetical protein
MKTFAILFIIRGSQRPGGRMSQGDPHNSRRSEGRRRRRGNRAGSSCLARCFGSRLEGYHVRLDPVRIGVHRCRRVGHRACRRPCRAGSARRDRSRYRAHRRFDAAVTPHAPPVSDAPPSPVPQPRRRKHPPVGASGPVTGASRVAGRARLYDLLVLRRSGRWSASRTNSPAAQCGPRPRRAHPSCSWGTGSGSGIGRIA